MSALIEKNISLDQELADQVARAVDLTFSRMLETPATVEKMEFKRSMSAGSDVFGVIDMVQQQTYGTFVLSFPKATIFNIMEQFYGTAFYEVDSSVRMGVGELTNVTFAVMKANLNLNGYDFQMAIPQVVAGRASSLAEHEGSAMDVRFSTKFGEFWVTISRHGASNGTSAKSA